jgi:hypothetical protein
MAHLPAVEAPADEGLAEKILSGRLKEPGTVRSKERRTPAPER